MKIAITTPAAADARNGNRHTASRWAGLLRGLGHQVSVGTEWDGGENDVLIALHARKSYPSIEKYRRMRPHAPLIVVLTGTDLYRDIKSDPEARHALELASRLVVLQTDGRRQLPERLRAKTQVIFQSANTAVRRSSSRRGFRVAVVGHLREEKDPFRTVIALARLPRQAELRVVHIGNPLSSDLGAEAARWMKREPRYRWLGGKTHAQTLGWIARSDLLVVSSIMEGGANVICEALRIGVPVLASRVSGNVGMLGGRYPGYFGLFDDSALAKLLERAAADREFYRRLKRAALGRRPLFTPSAERNALKSLLRAVV